MVLCGNGMSGFAQTPNYTEHQFIFDDASLLSWSQSIVKSESSSPPVRRLHRFPESSTASSIRTNYRTAYSVPPSSMPPKRPSDSSPSGTSGKLQKTEAKPDDFHNAVKKRLQSSTRTGQACDRCKVRKIRCDGLETGCSPCLQNHSECRTTDRITGVATRRGQLAELQQENENLKEMLRRHGINIPYQDSTPNTGYQNGPSYNSASQAWNDHASSQTGSYSGATAPSSHVLPSNVYGTILQNNSQMPQISSVMDILAILGMNIGDTTMTPEETAAPIPHDRSWKSFLQSVHGISPKVDEPELPPRHEGFQYADWYFHLINPYLPVLHKATSFTLLHRFYDEPDFKPTVHQSVTVHMIFAIMLFQYAIRNCGDKDACLHLNATSDMHYHYSLQKFYELSCSHTLQDAQAMALICSHLRNFPKPDASWMLSTHTIMLCKELGLHRSASMSEKTKNLPPYEIELRKRVFWCVLILNVGLSGKLGRPMPMQIHDFDIELPEAIDDNTMQELELPASQRSGRCSFQIGLQSMKLNQLYLEMYTVIYPVMRNPETCVATVNDLQNKLRQWKEGLPTELLPGSLSSTSRPEERVFALYVELWALEFCMLLRHPAVSMTTDATFNAESMRICVDNSRQILSIVKQLQNLKSLDTTWYNAAVFVVAVTTTLFSAWERRAEIGREEMDGIRQEMSEWLVVMAEIGASMGSGKELHDAVKIIMDQTMNLLSRNLGNAGAPRSMYLNPPAEETPSYNASRSPHSPHKRSNSSFHPSQPPPSITSSNTVTYYNDTPTPQTQTSYASTPYPAATQYYPQPTTSYPSFPDPVDAPLLAAFAEQASQQAGLASQNLSQNQNQAADNEPWRNQYTPINGHSHGHPQQAASAQNAISQLQHAAGGQSLGGQGMGGQLPPQYHSGFQGWQLFSSALMQAPTGAPNFGPVNISGQGQDGYGPGQTPLAREEDSMSAAVLLELGQGGSKQNNGANGDGQEMQMPMGGGWPGIVLDMSQGGQ